MLLMSSVKYLLRLAIVNSAISTTFQPNLTIATLCNSIEDEISERTVIQNFPNTILLFLLLQLPHLKQLGITHIVCVRSEIEAHIVKPYFPDDFQ